MIRSINEKINGRLKTIYKVESMSFEFPTFKVAEVEAAINIKDQATTDGKNDLPRTSSASGADISWVYFGCGRYIKESNGKEKKA